MTNRSAFRQVCDESSNGRVAYVVIVCPRCRKHLRHVTRQVNGFNEWSFTKSYNHAQGRTEYSGVDYDGAGCCF